MRTLSGSLTTLLNSTNVLLMADLLTITLTDNTVLRWTSYETDLVVSGDTFLAGGKTNAPLFIRGNTVIKSGLEVDTLQITLKVGTSVTLNGIPIQLAACNGTFDGARVKLERLFMATPGDTATGSVLLFEGRVSSVNPGSYTIELNVKSELEILNIQMPRNMYMPSCGHILYDSGCGLNKGTFTVTGSLTGTPTTTTLTTTRTEANGYFDLGVLQMTSGICSGSRRAIKSYTQASGTFVLALPLPSVPSASDTFSVYPGCKKDQNTCSTKFNNLTRFRGFPYVPRPESAH